MVQNMSLLHALYRGYGMQARPVLPLCSSATALQLFLPVGMSDWEPQYDYVGA